MDTRKLARTFALTRALPSRRLALSRARGEGPGLHERTVWLTNASGFRVRVHVHEPVDERPRPAVILVPGRGQSGQVFCDGLHILMADELAVHGIRVVHFDPVGRGESWGHDDFCGVEGQDSLRAVLDFVHARRNVLPDQVGVVSFSLGLALAVPVLAQEAARLGTRFLLDWEGPADRDAIHDGGPIPPAARTALAQDPEIFWARREPLRRLGEMPCRYVRIQGPTGHRPGTGVEGALSLLAAATQGEATGTQLNDNPPDTAWRLDQRAALHWAPSDPAALNRYLVMRIRALLAD